MAEASEGESTVVAVVTVVHGRHHHLSVQRAALATADPPPDVHVVVTLDDPGVSAVLAEQPALPTLEICMAVAAGGLPLAAARNAGAEAAFARGAELIVMLDVDCIPSPTLIARYRTAALTIGRDGLLAGPVTYLPPEPAEGWTPERVATSGPPHAARPAPEDGTIMRGEHHLFWSLSFAVRASTWRRIDGFDPSYEGYGGEDTDFAMKAKQAGVDLLWVGGAMAYHQHHPVSSPPVEHLDDILRNGEIFRRRWGWWPMQGWLREFRKLGLIEENGSGWTRSRPIRLASVPARHPYIEAVRPEGAVPVQPDRVVGWEPDPLLEPEVLRTTADGIDVIHLHFGYDHLTVQQLQAWLAVRRAHRLPLVVTVHDLRNPHHSEPALHEQQLNLLLDEADDVVTLTADAAAIIEHRYGRTARVLAHPTLSAPTVGIATQPGLVTLHLKSFRRNVVDAPALIEAAAEGACSAGGRLRVDVHSDVTASSSLQAVRQAARRAGAELCEHARFADDELTAYLSRSHVAVLPYRVGTHSGWLELCRDLGTRVVAPNCGCYGGDGGQWPHVISYVNDERVGFDPDSLTQAVASAVQEPAPAPADRGERLYQRSRIRTAHERIYRELTA
jgi:GT2 family glycosyltransferase